jgi:hypothetical protein
VTGWHDDVDCGGEVVALDRPGRNGRACKGARCHRVGRCVVSMCPVSFNRRARAEVRRSTGGSLVIDFPTQN